MNNCNHYIQIKRSILQGALSRLGKNCHPKPREEAVLSLIGDAFKIEIVGASETIDAQGQWDYQVRTNARRFLALAKSLPATEYAQVSFADDYLNVNNLSLPAIEQYADNESIEMPLQPSLLQYLELQEKYSSDRIKASGLEGNCKDAQDEATKLIVKAAKLLEPLEITETDLVNVVRDKIQGETHQ